MEMFSEEINFEIFKYIDAPISLISSIQKWYSVSKNPQTRAKSLIQKYGKTYSFFYAIRLNNFITSDVVQVLINQNAILSRYFIKRLVWQFGVADQNLNKIKARVYPDL